MVFLDRKVDRHCLILVTAFYSIVCSIRCSSKIGIPSILPCRTEYRMPGERQPWLISLLLYSYVC